MYQKEKVRNKSDIWVIYESHDNDSTMTHPSPNSWLSSQDAIVFPYNMYCTRRIPYIVSHKIFRNTKHNVWLGKIEKFWLVIKENGNSITSIWLVKMEKFWLVKRMTILFTLRKPCCLTSKYREVMLPESVIKLERYIEVIQSFTDIWLE